ncbi:hypothetical protein GCM10020295_00510 [Streptomyces cinereospinus]
MTEIGAGTYTRPGDPPEATSTIGRPMSGAEVRVVDREGTPVEPGTTGELQYRSPYMFHGYHAAPELTRAALTGDGWLRSGDLAALGPDGSVGYRGRSDELINRGGLKFNALEVEELLKDLPQLAQHAVLGRPDPRLGQRSCLVASLREGATGLTLSEVTAHLSAKGLATYKLPEQLVIVDALPTTVTGKIARSRLRELSLPPLATSGAPVTAAETSAAAATARRGGSRTPGRAAVTGTVRCQPASLLAQHRLEAGQAGVRGVAVQPRHGDRSAQVGVPDLHDGHLAPVGLPAHRDARKQRTAHPRGHARAQGADAGDLRDRLLGRGGTEGVVVHLPEPATPLRGEEGFGDQLVQSGPAACGEAVVRGTMTTSGSSARVSKRRLVSSGGVPKARQRSRSPRRTDLYSSPRLS